MSVAQEPLISKTPAWQALRAHQARMADVHMRALFEEGPRRAARFSLKDAGLFLDYSKNRIVPETLGLLLDLAHTARLEHAIGRMFAGERINTTEGRAVLHTALRNPGAEAVIVDGEDVMPSVRTVLARMRIFSEAVRSGEYRGMSGAPFTDVVNVGIGGSHLGPLLAVPHRVCPGNRPNNTLCYERLTPETLGALIGYRSRIKTARHKRSSSAIGVGPATSPSRPPPGYEPILQRPSGPSGAASIRTTPGRSRDLCKELRRLVRAARRGRSGVACRVSG